MRTDEVLRQVFDCLPPKEVASAMGIATVTVQKWAEPMNNGSGNFNPLDRVGQLIAMSREMFHVEQHPIIRFLGELGGFYPVPIPETQAHLEKLPMEAWRAKAHLVEQEGRSLLEMAEYIQTISDALIDGDVTQAEAETIRRECADLVIQCQKLADLLEREAVK